MDLSQGPFEIIREMLDTSRVIKEFNYEQARQVFKESLNIDKIFFTGEGSSRIFPAKHIIAKAMSLGLNKQFHTEGCYQAAEWDLSDWLVFGASNSGLTKEVILLFNQLKAKNIKTIALTANKDTPLEKISDQTFVLSCGKERAVAATKSVIEQAIFYDFFISGLTKSEDVSWLSELSDLSSKVLLDPISEEILEASSSARRVYFSGRNNGVAEELSLKSIEITRKPSMYLEGTLALHGVEEIMDHKELLVVVDPFENEEDQFYKILYKNIGINIIAISSRQTRFPTIIIPDREQFKPYLQLMAGWNLLINIGLKLGINIDKPERARKVGNIIIKG